MEAEVVPRLDAISRGGRGGGGRGGGDQEEDGDGGGGDKPFHVRRSVRARAGRELGACFPPLLHLPPSFLPGPKAKSAVWTREEIVTAPNHCSVESVSTLRSYLAAATTILALVILRWVGRTDGGLFHLQEKGTNHEIGLHSTYIHIVHSGEAARRVM